MFDKIPRALILTAALSAALLVACDEGSASKPATSEAEPAEQAEATEKTPPEADAKDAPEADEAAEGSDRALGVGSTPADIKPGEANFYGATFNTEGEPVPLAQAIKEAGDKQGPYKVEATIEKVCQKKGCWFTLQSEDVAMPIRVKMKDYAFFVPRNATGMPAVLEGTLEQVTVPQETAQHYADDEATATGEPAREIEGPQESWEFTASAVQITHQDEAG